MSESAGPRMVYRPVVSRIAVAGYVVFALWWALDDILTGDSGRISVVGPVLLAVGAALWGIFWRPSVEVADDGVWLRNLVRDAHVPWSLLESVDTRYALTLHVVGGRRYRSWAAGAPGRPMPLAHHGTTRDHDATGEAVAVRSSRSLRGDSGAAAFMVEQRWRQWSAARSAERSSARSSDGSGDGRSDGDGVKRVDEPVRVRVVWHWPLAVVVALAAAWLVAALR